jgi:hypothetical protein
MVKVAQALGVLPAFFHKTGINGRYPFVILGQFLIKQSGIEVSKIKGSTGPTRKPFFMHAAVAA